MFDLFIRCKINTARKYIYAFLQYLFLSTLPIYYVTLHANFIANKLGYYKLHKNATNMQDMM